MVPRLPSRPQEGLCNLLPLYVIRECSYRVSSGAFNQLCVTLGRALVKVQKGLVTKVLVVEEVKGQPAKHVGEWLSILQSPYYF